MEKAMTITYEVGGNLYLNITNRCPCACTFCIRTLCDGAYGSDPLWLEHEPSQEEIFAALEQRDLSRYREVVFCGFGEPTERLDAAGDGTLSQTARRAVHPAEHQRAVRPDSRQKHRTGLSGRCGRHLRQPQCRHGGGLSESNTPQVRQGGFSGNAGVRRGMQAVCAAGDAERGRRAGAGGDGSRQAARRKDGKKEA